LISYIWRLKQLEYSWLQTSLQDYRDFTFLTRASLDFALRAAGIEPRDEITNALFGKYLNLDPYPEARDALGKLKAPGLPPACYSVERQHCDAVCAGEELRSRRLSRG
jgi:2-haloacid dehalogenase